MISHEAGSQARQAGLTLPEVAVTVILFAILFIVVWQAFDLSSSEVAFGITNSSVDTTLRKCLSRLTEEIADSGSDFDGTDYVLSHPITADTSQARIQFQPRIDLTGDPATDWGNPISMFLVPSAGETVNGLDDDGDGVIDEQMLVRSQLPVTATTGELIAAATTIADGVTAINFTRPMNNFFVQVSITVSKSTRQGPLSRTLLTTIALRNRN